MRAYIIIYVQTTGNHFKFIFLLLILKVFIDLSRWTIITNCINFKQNNIQRVCHSNLGVPINIQDFNFDIRDKYSKISDGELFFIQFDDGSKINKILLFCAKRNLKLMVDCKTRRFCDGTFFCSPQIFSHRYTIYAVYYIVYI